jgi:hypothetical protein
VGRIRHGPRAGYGAGSEPRLDRMACFWSLPAAVLARAGAKLTPAGELGRRSIRGSPGGREGSEELITTDRSAK